MNYSSFLDCLNVLDACPDGRDSFDRFLLALGSPMKYPEEHSLNLGTVESEDQEIKSIREGGKRLKIVKDHFHQKHIQRKNFLMNLWPNGIGSDALDDD